MALQGCPGEWGVRTCTMAVREVRQSRAVHAQAARGDPADPDNCTAV